MKRILKALLSLAVILAPCTAWGQAQIYTRKAKMVDFMTKTTKVVLSSESPLENALRDEVSSRWRVSPYEFCSIGEYDKLEKSSNHYFLRFISEEGVMFLALSKGGDKDSRTGFDKPFEVIRVPVAPEGIISGRELIFIGAFVDIVQNFAEKSMESDRVAYSGLGMNNITSLKGKRILLDESEADDALRYEESGAIVPVIVISSNEDICYKMLLCTDSHEIVYFTKSKGKAVKSGTFSNIELNSFKKRNAEIIRTVPVEA